MSKEICFVQVWRQCLLLYSLKASPILWCWVLSAPIGIIENKETKEKKTHRGTSFLAGYNVLHLRQLICLTKWSFLLRISDWTCVVLQTAFQDLLGNTVGLIFYQLFSCWRSSSTLSLWSPIAHNSNFKLLLPTLDNSTQSLIIEEKIASWKSKSLALKVAKPTHFWISAIQLSNKISFQLTAGIDFNVKCLQNVAQVN